jgi:hypothetical protein
MIDNILDLIKAATSASSSGAVDVNAVIENCHPLGMLEESVMKSILAFENLGEDFHALYRTVLVDTPVGRYFTQFLTEIAEEKAASDIDHVRATFAEIPMPIIENSIKKYYLEDFHRFCVEECGGETAEIMGEVLATRADILAVNITVNSLHTDFSRVRWVFRYLATAAVACVPSLQALSPLQDAGAARARLNVDFTLPHARCVLDSCVTSPPSAGQHSHHPLLPLPLHRAPVPRGRRASVRRRGRGRRRQGAAGCLPRVRGAVELRADGRGAFQTSSLQGLHICVANPCLR